MQAQVQGQRELVRNVAQLLPVPPGGDAGSRFVDAKWLYNWANAPPTDVAPIDNQALLCEHGSLNPAAWADAKRVSCEAWHQLHAACKGGPELGLSDLCGECTRQLLHDILARCAAVGQAVIAANLTLTLTLTLLTFVVTNRCLSKRIAYMLLLSYHA